MLSLSGYEQLMLLMCYNFQLVINITNITQISCNHFLGLYLPGVKQQFTILQWHYIAE